MSDAERLMITGLNVAHAQLMMSAAGNGVKPNRIPPLLDFAPEVPDDDASSPERDFMSWARALLATLAV